MGGWAKQGNVKEKEKEMTLKRAIKRANRLAAWHKVTHYVIQEGDMYHVVDDESYQFGFREYVDAGIIHMKVVYIKQYNKRGKLSFEQAKEVAAKKANNNGGIWHVIRLKRNNYAAVHQNYLKNHPHMESLMQINN